MNKITIFSDTHGKHQEVDLGSGDILIFAGDLEARTEWGLRSFLEWFESQDYEYKVFVAGNHDFYLQRPDVQQIIDLYQVEYLEDESVTINDIKIWGSPWSLPFKNWAFMLSDEDLDGIYSQIPEDTDILVNHGAPKHILDTYDGNVTGSESLARHASRVRPDYCVFGHIHECQGKEIKDGTTYLNVAVLDENYEYTNQPVTINYKK